MSSEKGQKPYDAFFLGHPVADWGKPAMVYSDRGTQLVAAAGGMDPSTEEDVLDWEALGRITGVKWTFTPSEAQWKNGRAEALVKGT
mgnify:CR=1 FL=1